MRVFFFQAEDGIRDLVRSRGLGDVYKRQTRQIGIIGFTEFRNHGLTALSQHGVQLFDLEYDVHAFNSRLPRVRIIPIEEFDPAAFL